MSAYKTTIVSASDEPAIVATKQAMIVNDNEKVQLRFFEALIRLKGWQT